MPEAGLSIYRCAGCGRLEAKAPRLCRACGGDSFASETASGRGRLLSWTVIRRPPLRFQGWPPYAIAVVELQEGVRVTGRLQSFEPPPTLGADIGIAQVEEGVPIFA